MLIGPQNFIGPKIPFPKNWERQRVLGRKRRRSMFEPIPQGVEQGQVVSLDNPRVARRFERTNRLGFMSKWSAYNQAPHDPARLAIIRSASMGGLYQTMVGATLRMEYYRKFGLGGIRIPQAGAFGPGGFQQQMAAHANGYMSDARTFFEDSGRLSFVIHRWRVALRRRLHVIYKQLQGKLPTDLIEKISFLSYGRPSTSPSQHRYGRLLKT